MLTFREKTAVITGGASGIGLALAERFAAEGANVAICDINPATLQEAYQKLTAKGANCLAELIDISDRQAVLDFADKVFARFGSVTYLFNNAGVGGEWGSLIDTPQTNWSWCLNINVLGVVFGIEAFVGRMVKTGEPGYVVNTASISGLLPMPNAGAYSPSKFAVVSLTESLALELEDSAITVAMICPGFVNTGFLDSGRNLENAPTREEDQTFLDRRKKVKSLMTDSISASEIVERVLSGLARQSRYILTHSEYKNAFVQRYEKILAAFDEIEGVTEKNRI